MGLGFGAGRAWEEADGKSNMRALLSGIEILPEEGHWLISRFTATFKRGAAPTGRDGLRLVRS